MGRGIGRFYFYIFLLGYLLIRSMKSAMLVCIGTYFDQELLKWNESVQGTHAHCM